MDNIDDINNVLPRADLRQIRSFLLYGTDDFAEDVKPYIETLENASDPINKRLESIYPEGSELDNAAADLSKALTAREHVYMELGMKAGARLIYQLLFSDDSQKEANCEG